MYEPNSNAAFDSHMYTSIFYTITEKCRFLLFSLGYSLVPQQSAHISLTAYLIYSLQRQEHSSSDKFQEPQYRIYARKSAPR